MPMVLDGLWNRPLNGLGVMLHTLPGLDDLVDVLCSGLG
jgi:hypothetical protein